MGVRGVLVCTALASQSKTLAYDVLLRNLELSSVRALEDLLIECMYAGLLQGRLDQQAGHLEVYACAGRDVHPDELPNMATVLAEWQRSAGGLMAEVSAQLKSFRGQQEAHRHAQRELEERVDAIKASLREGQSSMGADGFGASGMEADGARMDFDDEKMRKSGRSNKVLRAPGKHPSARM